MSNWNDLGFDTPHEYELHQRVEELQSRLEAMVAAKQIEHEKFLKANERATNAEGRLDRALYLLNDAIANAELDGPAAIDVAAAAVLVSEIESERNGTDYVVRCARCGRALTAHLAVPEEGDEWECPPCNAAHHKIERLELLRDEAAELIGLTLKDHDVGLTEDVGLAYRDRCNKWLSNAGVVERQEIK